MTSLEEYMRDVRSVMDSLDFKVSALENAALTIEKERDELELEVGAVEEKLFKAKQDIEALREERDDLESADSDT